MEHILALVKAIPDPRWRFAFQLMAAYGLWPEELQHLQIRLGRLSCTYEKVSSRGKTKPRVLRLRPCDDWADMGGGSRSASHLRRSPRCSQGWAVGMSATT